MRRLLEQAFQETMASIERQRCPTKKKRSVLRRAVSKLIPKATRIAWTLKKATSRKISPP